MAETTENYITSLEEKIKERNGHLEEAKRKLSELLESIPPEVEEMRRDIEYLRNRGEPKSLLDLPDLVCEILLKYLLSREEDLFSLSRVSPSMHHRITVDMKQNTLRLTGIMVFGLLIENQYLDKQDLKNCSRVSEEFGTFSGTAFQLLSRAPDNSWSYDREKQFKYLVIYNVASLFHFVEYVRKKCFPWKTFFGICLEFRWYSDGNKENEIDFWGEVERFLKNYGDHITHVCINDCHQENSDSYQQQLLYRLASKEFQDLPRLQNLSFKETSTGEINHVCATIDRRTRHRSLILISDSTCSAISTWISVFLPQFSTWSVRKLNRLEEPHRVCKSLNERLEKAGDDHRWRLKQLNIQITSFSSTACKYFLSICPTARIVANRIETLTVLGFFCSKSVFVLAANFPSLRKFNVLGRSGNAEGCIGLPDGVTLPMVQEVTFPIITDDYYVPVQRLLDTFPSLKYLQLELIYRWKKNKSRFTSQFERDPIDIYRSCFHNQSIETSNIWEATRTLQMLSFKTFFALKCGADYKRALKGKTFCRTAESVIVSKKEFRVFDDIVFHPEYVLRFS